VPFKFTGKIDKLTISVEPPELTPADVEKLMIGWVWTILGSFFRLSSNSWISKSD